MLQITEGRIRDYCRFLLDQGGETRNIGFVDADPAVNPKEPWALLPAERVSTFDFEPHSGRGQRAAFVRFRQGRLRSFFCP